ncbi:hypothetical protein ABIE44_001370 [Marmoricola sp. OAE513]|uniref:type IV toxin-antitoxin system AbiEi family antitoxin domain-containing protein n=1 Tax=Marmoricola sp. OAE513 TaxID=2817894 RepID=UPI001AE99C4B
MDIDRDLPFTDRPFTYQQALATGVSRRRLRTLLDAGLVRRLLAGVYVRHDAQDSQLLRARALALVVPKGYVVTDESAGWLAGAPMILRPGSHLAVPPLTIFGADGQNRLRNELTDSGRRRLIRRDIHVVHGIQVTTPLRTALDLGRLRQRDRAIAALDQLMAVGRFSHEDLQRETLRLRGFRGVRQLRALTPLVDPRSESPGESALRLRFHDAGLPRPECQLDIHDEDGVFLGRGDLAIEDIRFLAEYDGERWHGEGRAAHDAERRDALKRSGWTVRVLTKADVFGRTQDVTKILIGGVNDARARMWTWNFERA